MAESKIRVLFVSRRTLYTTPGGDTTQLEKTAEYLRMLGVHVDIDVSGRLDGLEQYSLIHVFNMIRPADCMSYFRQSKVPVVLSTIYVSYAEYENNTKQRRLLKFLPMNLREYIKVVGRRLVNGEKIGDWRYLILGHRRSVRSICNKAKMLLPNSNSEYGRVSRDYSLQRPFRVIPNAIDTRLFALDVPPDPEFKDAVLCVARIDGIKNQVNLIKALNGAPYEVFLIGKPAPNQISYFETCKGLAEQNIHFIDHLPHERLPSIYAAAKVHALSSWFETTGLCSLEAGATGCSLVVTDRGDQKEYFDGYAEFCAPDDIASIRRAVDAAFYASKSTAFAKVIQEKFTWQRAAEATLAAYREVLGLGEG